MCGRQGASFSPGSSAASWGEASAGLDAGHDAPVPAGPAVSRALAGISRTVGWHFPASPCTGVSTEAINPCLEGDWYAQDGNGERNCSYQLSLEKQYQQKGKL